MLKRAPPENVDRLDLERCREDVLSSVHSSRVALNAHKTTSRQMSITLDCRFRCTSELATANCVGDSHRSSMR
jgi:hypothetical protein